MSEATAPCRLHYRHVPIAEDAILQPVAQGVFVALQEPPPVRTILRVIAADGTARTLEVTRVVEVAESDAAGACGVYGRFVDDATLARSVNVGSEHLEGASVGSQPAGTEPQGSGTDDGSDIGNAAMAMPAPVLVHDEDDEGEAEAGDIGEPEAGDSASEPESADSDAEPESEASDRDAAADDAGSGRPARARKRRPKKPRK